MAAFSPHLAASTSAKEAISKAHLSALSSLCPTCARACGFTATSQSTCNSALAQLSSSNATN
eukprot:7191664-Ditylum_brightwellii.AAC.1